jgi:hypothetical protein
MVKKAKSPFFHHGFRPQNSNSYVGISRKWNHRWRKGLMDGAPPTAATMAKISEVAFIPRQLTVKRISKTSPMRGLTRNPQKIDPERAEESITRERAWWRERGGGLKLTRPRTPQPKHYTAATVQKAEPAQMKTETALDQPLKTKRSKSKKWKDLVQMMSLTTFVSRKFAEIDEVHRVSAHQT